MVEAKVVSISNQHHTYALTKEGAVFVEATNKDTFLSDVKSISEAYKSRWGVVIGNTSIVLNACEISGRKVGRQHYFAHCSKSSFFVQKFNFDFTR